MNTAYLRLRPFTSLTADSVSTGHTRGLYPRPSACQADALLLSHTPIPLYNRSNIRVTAWVWGAHPLNILYNWYFQLSWLPRKKQQNSAQCSNLGSREDFYISGKHACLLTINRFCYAHPRYRSTFPHVCKPSDSWHLGHIWRGPFWQTFTLGNSCMLRSRKDIWRFNWSLRARL